MIFYLVSVVYIDIVLCYLFVACCQIYFRETQIISVLQCFGKIESILHVIVFTKVVGDYKLKNTDFCIEC